MKGNYLQRQDFERALAMIDRIVVLQPQILEERRDRGLVRYQLGRYKEAQEDLQSYLDSVPPGTATEDVERLVSQLEDLLGK